MPKRAPTAPPFVDGLYATLVERGVGYFFPDAEFAILEPEQKAVEHGTLGSSSATKLLLNCLGTRYSLSRAEPFSDAELKLIDSIGAVLDSRYRMLVDTAPVEQRFEPFRGLPEDVILLIAFTSWLTPKGLLSPDTSRSSRNVLILR